VRPPWENLLEAGRGWIWLNVDRPSEKSLEPELTRFVAGELGRKSGEWERAQSITGGLGHNVAKPRGVDLDPTTLI